VKNIKIKSYCKINLSLGILKRLNTGYHNIRSLITFCDLHDVISISKIKDLKDRISFTGKFKRGIDQRFNTVSKVLNLLRKDKLIGNQIYKINIHKNIPHGSGLGGGSSNAAALLNHFNDQMRLKLNRKKMVKLAEDIGFDVPINLKKKNTFLTGKKGQIIRLNQKFKLNILVVYPNLICSTKEIYEKNKKISVLKSKKSFNIKNHKKLINYLKENNNDLQETASTIYPEIKKIITFIESLKGCHFSRITGSGSACIGIFFNMKNAIFAMKLIKLKYPKYWCVVSKTI